MCSRGQWCFCRSPLELKPKLYRAYFGDLPMKKKIQPTRVGQGLRFAVILSASCFTSSALLFSGSVHAAPLAGGTLNPLDIPKFVTPLLIPPVMKYTNANNNYIIAERQFKQQILPGGLWNTLNGRNDAFPATTIWSYGPDVDGMPDSTSLGGGMGIAPAANSQFNYPSYTIENLSNTTATVTWINSLLVDPVACATSKKKATDPSCNYLSHLLPVDRSLHWANPEQLPCTDPTKTKDCRPMDNALLSDPYPGPVPMIPHVHGAHVGPESDGYPESWWLPAANNIPASYATTGTLVNQYGIQTNTKAGQAKFKYPNTQPSTTLWYHDHTLGMTRSNVYAGPAGFWIIRDAKTKETGLVKGRLPSPAPALGDTLAKTNFPGTATKRGREQYREIPIVIQDRSFNVDGSLFYPKNRAFFEGLGDGQDSGRDANVNNGLDVAMLGMGATSDMSPIWNPEAFFNVMVVNGVSWPTHTVAQAMYRFRLLNGCNSRFLNLAMFVVNSDGSYGNEVPFYQIGAEQSLLPKVVKIQTGARTILPGDGSIPLPTATSAPEMALLMGLAERADVLVDFSGLDPGTHVRMINTAPDSPFGGFPVDAADPSTTGQVMEFVVDASLNGTGNTDPSAKNPATKPESLVLSLPDATSPSNAGVLATKRDLALMEESSNSICVTIDAVTGAITQEKTALPNPDPAFPDTCIYSDGTLAPSVVYGPKAAVLGINGSAGGVPTLWADPIQTNPALGSSETWEIWNTTEDGHPIHVHLVKFKVVNREAFDPASGLLTGNITDPEANEMGWKDTVVAYPGQVTRINATFDTAGLYVWHCHIVEHEDNEMMVPYCVGDKTKAPGCRAVP